MHTKYKYLLILLLSFGFIACEIDDTIEPNLPPEAVLPPLNTNGLDFSNYVALGASFTGGFTDGALFIAGQQNSFPYILSQQFGNATFTQPLMNDNIGGLLFNGAPMADGSFGPRFFFDGAGPATLPGTPTTEVFAGTPGPYNNMGVPGAKSFHLLFDGYGNPANLATATANPYFVRMASSPTATMLGDAMAQNPSFFTLSEIGGNDVLGYALSGGDGTNPITPSAGPPGVGFDQTFGFIVATLTSGGARGVVTNVPYITDLPNFTAIPYDFLDPDDPRIGPALVPQIDALNQQLYGPLDNIFTAFGEPDRINLLSPTSANPLLIHDEDAIDRSAEITAALTPQLGAQTAAAFGAIFGKARQATANDLILLASATIIGTEAAGVPAPVNVNGISFPLPDNLVLLPSEQDEIRDATDAYNLTIGAVADGNPNVALVDLNAILTEASTTGVMFDDFTLTTSLVTGGLVSLDGIHLTAKGYALMANKFLEAIDDEFGTNFIESGTTAKAVNYPTNYSPTLQ
ncbi:MAG: G-D-S-L family lipolytic protein [Flavobacteriaceae bacterium]|nr:G-D-S-L family lipolytic protein [Flavobacteriaceae bacterium]